MFNVLKVQKFYTREEFIGRRTQVIERHGDKSWIIGTKEHFALKWKVLVCLQ